MSPRYSRTDTDWHKCVRLELSGEAYQKYRLWSSQNWTAYKAMKLEAECKQGREGWALILGMLKLLEAMK